MTLFWGALRAELRKAAASRLTWATGSSALVFPLIGIAFMFIAQDPERAKALGIVGAKARLAGLTADWPSYLAFLNQATVVGFTFLLALFVSWLVGREWSDRTLKLLLAVPAGRGRVVAAKLTVIGLWGLGALTGLGGAALVLGGLAGLPGWTDALGARWAGQFAAGGGLTLTLATWVAFFASWGKGYLWPLAWTVITVVAAQLSAALGLASAVPWAAPALAAGVGNLGEATLSSVLLVLLTGGAGAVATHLYWARADHPR